MMSSDHCTPVQGMPVSGASPGVGYGMPGGAAGAASGASVPARACSRSRLRAVRQPGEG